MKKNKHAENPYKIIKQNRIIYLINKEDKTAKIIGSASVRGDIIISRSIYHQEIEYIIIEIGKKVFKDSKLIETIKFPPDSEIKIISEYAFTHSSIEKIILPPRLKIIGKGAFLLCSQLQEVEIPKNSELEIIEGHAFDDTNIESITLPASVKELKEGWCLGLPLNATVTVSQGNKRYSNFGKELVIGKSTIESEIFDEIVFCVRYVKEIKIPDFITKIGPYSFSDSVIEKVKIPKHVKTIGKSAFSTCERLFEVEFPIDSELQTIEARAFSESSIEKLTIPASVIDIRDEWCSSKSSLISVKISPDNKRYMNYTDELVIGKSNIESSIYDEVVFCSRNAKKVKIPNFIKNIKPFSFHQCLKLKSIEFPIDSKLQKFGAYSVSFTSIKKIKIPKSVTKIGDNSFFGCKQLTEVEIPNDSELQIIEENAFCYTGIKSFTIPPKLFEIEGGLCIWNSDLVNVKVSPKNKSFLYLDNKLLIKKTDPNSDEYDCLVFARRDIQNVTIPSFIKSLGPRSFSFCDKLHSIEITSDSKLQTIGDFAFYSSSIKTFKLPKKVTNIGVSAFRSQSFKKIDIPDNSELRKIGMSAFCESNLKSFYLPPHLTLIDEEAFNGELRIAEIDENTDIDALCKLNFMSWTKTIISYPIKLRKIFKKFSSLIS